MSWLSGIAGKIHLLVAVEQRDCVLRTCPRRLCSSSRAHTHSSAPGAFPPSSKLSRASVVPLKLHLCGPARDSALKDVCD